MERVDWGIVLLDEQSLKDVSAACSGTPLYDRLDVLTHLRCNIFVQAAYGFMKIRC